MQKGIHIKIGSEAELLVLTRKLFHIVVNMRRAQIDFHAHYGADRANKRKAWETQCDNLIEEYVVKDTDDENINIEINNTKNV